MLCFSSKSQGFDRLTVVIGLENIIDLFSRPSEMLSLFLSMQKKIKTIKQQSCKPSEYFRVSVSLSESVVLCIGAH